MHWQPSCMERSLLGPNRAAWVTAPIHRNIAVGHRLEVGKIDTSEALADSTVGSLWGTKARKPARVPFRPTADSHDIQFSFHYR